MKENAKTWLGEHALALLIAAQPLLDALAYFTRDGSATPAGWLRLGLLVLLPLYVLLTAEKKRPFLLGLLAIGAYCLLHVLNLLRLGPIRLSYDLAMLARVVQMPVLCLCLIRLIRNKRRVAQAFRGLLWAAALTALCLGLAWLTGTGNSTYGEGLGFSGWVIDDNRCAGSILLVTLSVFAVGHAAGGGRRVAWLIPPAAALILLANGTKACYYGLFAIFGAFAAWLLLEKLLLKKPLKAGLFAALLLLMLLAAAAYPLTPRARVDRDLAEAAARQELAAAPGVDLAAMSLEERYRDPEARALLAEYYQKELSVLPDLTERFGVDRVMRYYRMSIEPRVVMDVRRMERCYAHLIWEDADALTKLLGFEATELSRDGGLYDLENDGHALFYCYGYLGFGLYLGFVLAFLLRILRQLKRDFRGSLRVENFALALCLGLQLGLAQFSGALVRRPNVSFYLALVLALIWAQTGGKERSA